MHINIKERIILRAKEISVSLGYNNVTLPSLVLSLLEEESVQKHISSLKQDVEKIKTEIQDLLISQPETLQLSDENHLLIDKLISHTDTMVNNSQPPIANEHYPLALLFIILLNTKESKTFAILQKNGLVSKNNKYQIPNTKLSISSLKQETKMDEKTAPLYTSLSKYYEENLTDNLIYVREDLTESLLATIARNEKHNPLLVGENGVGKKSLINGMVQAIELDKYNPHSRLQHFEHIEVFEIDMATIISSNDYGTEMKETLKKVIDQIRKKALQNKTYPVIFIPDIHELTAYATSCINLLQKEHQENHITFVASTTPLQYNRVLKNNTVAGTTLHNLFSKIDVDEPDDHDLRNILSIHQKRLETYHGCIIDDETIEIILANISTENTSITLPGRAIDILDETCAKMNVLDDSLVTYKKHQGQTIPVITPDMVENITQPQPKDKNRKQILDAKTALNLSNNLKKIIFDQDEAIEAVAKCIKTATANLNEDDKPIGSLFFKGPTGVGKTELAKQLAKSINADFVRINMSEYNEKHNASRLIGSPPGYVGHDQGSQLGQKIPKDKRCVLLLDEIEKAHPDVHNTFLQVMDAAELTDGQDNTIDFRNVVLIMTSNVGSHGEIKNSIGFKDQEKRITTDGDFEKLFPPEFRNRLNAIIDFNSFSSGTMLKIVNKIADEFATILPEKSGMSFEITTPAKKWLAEHGHDPRMGARPLKKLFEEKVKAPISEKILENSVKQIKTEKVKVSLKSGNKKDLSLEFSGHKKIRKNTKNANKPSIRVPANTNTPLKKPEIGQQ